MISSNEGSADIILKIYEGISSGLLYTHSRINSNTAKNMETASFLYVLIELLNEKGILTIE